MGFVAFDTETTGVDLYHGAKPFMVTACTDEGEVTCWEWAVDPLTREPLIPDEDLDEIRTLLFDAERLILQNPKFDAAAMLSVGIDDWPWEKTEDTLTAGHLLASKMPHDLTSMAQQYLGIDIQPYEDRLEVACKKARNLARKHFPEWMIAKEGLPNMPSIKGGKGKESKGSESEKPWKNDMWLLRELARELEYRRPDDDCLHNWQDETCTECDGNRWWILVSEYAVKDVEVTALLWSKQLELIKRRNLLDIYRTVVKRPKLAFTMERYGVTYSTVNHQEMVSVYEAESERQGARCVNIAESYGYTLELPKTSNNNSLRTFCFDHLCLPAVKRSEKTGEPSLDKEVMSHYLITLPIRSRELTFIRSLLDKRSRDTALTYLAAYRRFSLPLEEGWELLHPSLNPTGSDTLRWTCANPNEQNISKREIACSYCAGDGCNSCGGSGKGLRSLRYCFGPAPGREWYSCDAKNIELRLPAYESGEPDMIALFEHPDDPPFYGSNHMLIFSVLWPDLWNAAVKEVGLEKAASYCKKKYADTNYQWTKNGNFACVPMDTEALTKDGWKKYGEIKVGDEVLGHEDGKLIWTPVLSKVKYQKAPVVRMKNTHFDCRSTPNHRWLSTRRRGSSRNGTRKTVKEFCRTDQVVQDTKLILSCEVVDPKRLNISKDEAAIIGFVYGDGSIERSEFCNASSQAGGQKVKFRVRLFQSKPKGVKYVDSLLSKWGKRIRRSVRPHTGIVVWELDADDARDLWKRAELYEQGRSPDMEGFVLKLGTEARKAFLNAVFEAEGSTDRLGYKLYAQNCGKFADAIKLAVFMTGNFPTVSYPKNYYGSGTQPSVIRASKPFVTGQRIIKTEEKEQEVWCIKTKLDTWVMRQGDQIMLTGNTQYGAIDRPDGTGTADRAYHLPGAQRKVKSRFAKQDALNNYWIEFANKHGYVETIPDKTVDPRRGYPLMCTRTEYGKILPTVPLNYHIQSSAMWWMMKAMIRCQEKLDQWNEEAGIPGHYRITMQIHDELVFDFPKSHHCPVAESKRLAKNPKGFRRPDCNLHKIRILQKLMEKGGDDFGIPTPTSCEFHEHNWSEGVAV